MLNRVTRWRHIRRIRKSLLPKPFYSAGGSRVAAEGQYGREFSVKKLSWLIFGLLMTYRDIIQTETSAANVIAANEQRFHMEMIEIWCELWCKMQDLISLIYSFMKADLYLLVIRLHGSSFVCLYLCVQ
jgi:hypothetical protein